MSSNASSAYGPSSSTAGTRGDGRRGPAPQFSRGRLGSSPATCRCPDCGASVETSVKKEPGSMAWIVCLVLCCLGCVLCAPCAFCVESLKVTKHYCPNCDHYLGEYKGGANV